VDNVVALAFEEHSTIAGPELSTTLDTPLRIGHHRQLFLDDWLVAKMERLDRKQGVPVKHPANPVLRRDKPWEAARCELYGSAVWNPLTKKIQLFYSAMSKPYDTRLAYAESADGITWNKPELALFPFGDSEKTNIVWQEPDWVHGPTVFRDPGDPDPLRRYKLLTTMGDHTKGIGVYFSPDGIHWAASKNNPILKLHSDTGNCAFWDPILKTYVAYVRIHGNGRCVGRTESTDFETWSEPEIVYPPSTKDRARKWDHYGHSVTPYEGLYVGLTWIFPVIPVSWDPKAHTPVTWPELTVSRDGRQWQRVAFGKPFLPPGPLGSFDHRQIRTASSLVVLEDRILLLYSGSPDAHVRTHKFDIGLATLRLDGFASLDAGVNEGILLTRPLSFEAGKLWINAIVQPGGYVKAELLGADGKPLSGYDAGNCYGYQGDSLHVALAWKGKTSVPSSPKQGTRVRFLLKNAKLYSFMVEPE